jgi:hypothetical protein
MKKTMDLSTIRNRKARKDPTYTPREDVALDNADRIVLRVRIRGEWHEKEEFQTCSLTLLDRLIDIQTQLRHSPDLRGVCLYVGGLDPRTGGRMIASVPHDWVPENVRIALEKRR